MNTTTVSLPPTLELNIDLTDEQFFQLCQNNRDLKFERTASGELIIMPPTGSSTSDRNADLTYQLRAWSRQNKLGKSFDSFWWFQTSQRCRAFSRCFLGENGTVECFK